MLMKTPLVRMKARPSTCSVWSVYAAESSKVFFSPLGRVPFSFFVYLSSRLFDIPLPRNVPLPSRPLGGSVGGFRPREEFDQGIKREAHARTNKSKEKKTAEREKNKPFVLRLLRVWLKKRGSVHPQILCHVKS